jgi:alpha-1,3-rhamnosyl/mannosyltransferase
MNLLINTESLRPPLTGIANYTYHLVKELSASRVIDRLRCFDGQKFLTPEQMLRQCDEAAAGYQQASPARNAASSRLTAIARRVPGAYRTRQAIRDLRLLAQNRQHRGYIYHEPNFILKNHPGPKIATIHDLSFIHYPQFHPIERVQWMMGGLNDTIARADMLLTVSELVRQELIESLGVEPERVRAIHLGVDSCYYPRDCDQTSAVLDKHGLQHGRYLLFVGTLEPRKGVDILLEAWARLPTPLRREFPLVLAGSSGWRNQGMLDRIAELQATEGLRRLEYVPASDLPLIYAGATAFAYPSLYEGFGLPVLEAMASGVPVVCTAGTSMAEFAGEAPVLFEQGSVESLGESLRQLLEDVDLRHQRSIKGQQLAGEFTWQRFASRTYEAYRAIANY